MNVILASGSPRRKQLLENMGIRGFQIVKPEFDESSVAAGDPAELVEALSRGKAAAAAALAGEGPLLIAADTVVILGDAVLGKPAGEADAFRMLTALAGKRHQVYTGVTVRRGGTVITEHEVTEVAFRPLSAGEIRNYIATGEPMDKAGSYGIQGFGSLLVEGIKGDYFNVMGLPVCRLGLILRQFGLDCLRLAGQ